MLMAYNQNNQEKRDAYIRQKYTEYKEKNYDRTDTYIVKKVLPEHGILISIRTLQNIINGRTYRKKYDKAGRHKVDPSQMSLFS